MEFEDNSEPPKKKLKQAQLPFCNQLVKTNKRKCSNDAIGDKQACKIVCKTDENVMNKENVIVIDESTGSLDTSMDICETPNSETVKTSSESEAKEVGELVKNSTNNSELKITSKADAVEEQITLTDKNVSQSKLNQINIKSNMCSDVKKQENPNKNVEIDTVVIDNSDEGNVKENEMNVTCDDTLNKSQSLSVSSEDETCEENNKSTVVSPNSSSANTLKRKLTPKGLEKRKLRESLKQEKLHQKEREKEAKLKMKLEKDEQKRKEKEEREEQKRKEKEEKEEQKRKEKEEKEKKRLAEIKQKEDEKRLKEQEKKRKEEERRLKEEEKRRKEEAKEEEKRKKEEAKLIEQRKEDQAKKFLSNYFNYLKKSKTDNAESTDTNNQPKFMPFPVKPDMRLAEVNRRMISNEDKTKLESYFNADVFDGKLYLEELKAREHIPQNSEPTWLLSEEQHDVIIIESVVDGELVDGSPEDNKKSKRNLRKAKLLQFHENRRPAYWGTWRKKSKSITSRRPFLKDECLNYEIDSDSEWEDEGEGEDIGNDDDSDKEHSDEENSDEKDENGYILDNTFVPHGYLSDEEVQPDEENFDPEDQKLRLKVLKREFDEEMKMRAERLKPRLLGCVWISNDTTAVSKGSLYEVLMKYRAVWDEDNGPIKVIGPTIEESPTVPSAVKNRSLSPKVMEQLVKFVHGNHLSFHILVQEFRNLMEKEDYPILSKRALSIKIKEIASKELDESGKYLWTVNNEVCNEYGLPPVSQLNATNVEKSKDTFLDNFLKRPSISPQPMVKTSSISTPKNELPAPSSSSMLQAPSTLTPQPVKKRATLITLQQTPTNTVNKTNIKVHKDTPRPAHAFFKTVHHKDLSKNIKQDTNDDGVINLCDDN